MNKLSIVLVVLAVSGAFAFWTPCGDLPAPNDIVSAQCNDVYCEVYRGSQLRADVHMTARHVHQVLDVKFSTNFLGIDINLTIPEGRENACWHLRGGGCPTVIGNDYVWEIDSPISTLYPAMSNVLIRGELEPSRWVFQKLNFFSLFVSRWTIRKWSRIGLLTYESKYSVVNFS